MTAKEVPKDDEVRDRESGVDHRRRDHGEANPLDVRLMDQEQVVGEQKCGQQAAADQGEPRWPVDRQRPDEAGSASQRPRDRAHVRDEADVCRPLENRGRIPREVSERAVEYHPCR